MDTNTQHEVGGMEGNLLDIPMNVLGYKFPLPTPQESIIIRPYVALDSQISAAIPVS